MQYVLEIQENDLLATRTAGNRVGVSQKITEIVWELGNYCPMLLDRE